MSSTGPQASKPGVNWELAHKRRNMLLFRKRTKLGHFARYSIFESLPWELQKHSAGLGVYFTTLSLLALLMMLTTLISLYPLGSNWELNRMSGSLRIVAPELDDLVCNRQTVRADFQVFLATTAGSRCDPRIDNREDQGRVLYNRECPLVCDWQTDIASCMPLQSCPTRNTTLECCNLRMYLPDDVTRLAPVGQWWIWCTGFVAMYLLWLLVLQKAQSLSASSANKKTISAADYSVLVSGVDGSTAKDDALKEFARHYGEVVMAFNIRAMGNVLLKCNEIRESERKLEELALLRSGDASALASLYWSAMSLFKSPEAAYRSEYERREKLHEQRTELEGREVVETGYALVVFNKESHADNMKLDHTRDESLGVRYLFTPGVVRRFHALTGGMLSNAPRLTAQPDTGDTSHPASRFVIVSRAPEPSDVWWENTLPRRVVGWRKLLGYLLYCSTLLAAGAIQFWVTRGAEQEREDLVAGDIASLRWKAITQGIVVSTINAFVPAIIDYSARLQRSITTTNFMTHNIMMLTLFFVVNSFVIPTIVLTVLDFNAPWYTRAGVAESAFWILLGNVVIPDFFILFDPVAIINYRVLSQFALSQPFLDFCLAPRPFLLEFRLASAVKTVTLAVLYAPALPIAPLLGFLALITSYMTDLFVSLTWSRAPADFDPEVLEIINYMLRLLPLTQLLLIYLYYFTGYTEGGGVALGADLDLYEPGLERQLKIAFYTGLALWLLVTLSPVAVLFRIARDRDHESGGTGQLPFKEIFGNMRLNATAVDHREKVGANIQYVPSMTADVEQRVIAEIYSPGIPSYCTKLWRDKVTRSIQFLRPTEKPNRDPLPNQKQQTVPLREPVSVAGTSPSTPSIWQLHAVDSIKIAMNEQMSTFYPRPVYTLKPVDDPESIDMASLQASAPFHSAFAPLENNTSEPGGAATGPRPTLATMLSSGRMSSAILPPAYTYYPVPAALPASQGPGTAAGSGGGSTPGFQSPADVSFPALWMYGSDALAWSSNRYSYTAALDPSIPVNSNPYNVAQPAQAASPFPAVSAAPPARPAATPSFPTPSAPAPAPPAPAAFPTVAAAFSPSDAHPTYPQPQTVSPSVPPSAAYPQPASVAAPTPAAAAPTHPGHRFPPVSGVPAPQPAAGGAANSLYPRVRATADGASPQPPQGHSNRPPGPAHGPAV